MWQIKNNPDEAVVPWRIQAVIDRVKERAENKGLPAELAEALWRHDPPAQTDDGDLNDEDTTLRLVRSTRRYP